MMLDYKSPTRRAVHDCTYPLREGTTIGNLTDMILRLKMHYFLFLPYTAEGRRKGCGDHVYALSFSSCCGDDSGLT